VLRFGPQVIALGPEILAKHWIVIILAAAGGVALGIFAWTRWRE